MNLDNLRFSWLNDAPWYLRAASALVAPHFSITDVGEKRRAQVLAILALIISGVLGLALLFRPTGISSFLVMLIVALISYVLSRTRYYWFGNYLFSYGIASTAYLSLFLGTARGFSSAIATTAHISLILASILLPFGGFISLVVISTIATFAAPLYSNTPITSSEDYFRTAGVLMSIGIILIGAYALRARVERERVREVSDVNRELEKLTDELEDRVRERTAD